MNDTTHWPLLWSENLLSGAVSVIYACWSVPLHCCQACKLGWGDCVDFVPLFQRMLCGYIWESWRYIRTSFNFNQPSVVFQLSPLNSVVSTVRWWLVYSPYLFCIYWQAEVFGHLLSCIYYPLYSWTLFYMVQAGKYFHSFQIADANMTVSEVTIALEGFGKSFYFLFEDFSRTRSVII